MIIYTMYDFIIYVNLKYIFTLLFCLIEMGIHNLIRYIHNSNQLDLSQCVSGDNIYISNIVYFDITYKLIEMYNKFMSLHTDDDFNNNIQSLIKYIENELLMMFNRLKYMNRIIYVFIDYKFINNLKERNVIFKDFLNIDINPRERFNAIPMIKRKYLKLCNTDDIDVIIYLIKKVRCMFELKSIYSISNKLNMRKYISIPYIIHVEKNATTRKCFEILNNEGIFRYSILRGGKYVTRKNRTNGLYKQRMGVNAKNNDVSECHSECKSEIQSECHSEIQSEQQNISPSLNDTHGYAKCNFNNEQYEDSIVPFTLLVYIFPNIVKHINDKIKNINFFGCEIESDFALSKHVHTYSKYAYPTIYSSDTDMLCLMCDVNCIIKLSINSNVYCKHSSDSNNRRTFLFVNPVLFWQGIFGCTLKKRIIIILCVLMGTDYNPYDSKSPIHIKYFSDILSLLHVEKYEDISEEILLSNIYSIIKNNEDNIHCKQTVLALNVYLNDLEDELHYITGDNVKVNMDLFIKYSKQIIYT